MNAETVLADTNVLSYWINNVEPGSQYSRMLAGRDVRTCFISAGELLYGARKKAWGERRSRVLRSFLLRYPVVPYRLGIEEVFARIADKRRRSGRQMKVADAWIAATAVWYDIPLATHDGDFSGIPELKIITIRDTWGVKEQGAQYRVMSRPVNERFALTAAAPERAQISVKASAASRERYARTVAARPYDTQRCNVMH